MTTLYQTDTTPALTDPEGGELDHLCCCTWNVAICGLDVSDEDRYEVHGLVTLDQTTCPACAYNASDDDWRCAFCGCAWYQSCPKHFGYGE
jgi:hypothetical protein